MSTSLSCARSPRSSSPFSADHYDDASPPKRSKRLSGEVSDDVLIEVVAFSSFADIIALTGTSQPWRRRATIGSRLVHVAAFQHRSPDGIASHTTSAGRRSAARVDVARLLKPFSSLASLTFAPHPRVAVIGRLPFSVASGLRKLKLGPASATRAILRTIATACGALECLSLAGCSDHVGDAFLKALACPRLEKINLRGCPLVRDKGVIALVGKCPKLRVMLLGRCDYLTNAALEGIARAKERAEGGGGGGGVGGGVVVGGGGVVVGAPLGRPSTSADGRNVTVAPLELLEITSPFCTEVGLRSSIMEIEGYTVTKEAWGGAGAPDGVTLIRRHVEVEEMEGGEDMAAESGDAEVAKAVEVERSR